MRVLFLVFALLLGAGAALLPAPPAHAAVPDAFAYGYRDAADPVPAPLHQSVTSAFSTGQVTSFAAPNHYTVRFPSAGKPLGVVHVTAISKPASVPSWCEPDYWKQVGADEVVVVSCFVLDSLGNPNPYQTGFSVTFSASTPPPPAGNDYAYVESDGGAGVITQFNQTGGPPTVNHISTGYWQVKLPGVGVPGTAQGGSFQATGLTGPGGVPTRCKVSDWLTGAAQLIYVRCFEGHGTPFDTAWSLSYQNQRDITGRPSPSHGFVWKHATAPPATNLNSVLGYGTNTTSFVAPASTSVQYPSLTTLPATVQITAYGVGPEFCRMSDTSLPPWQNPGGMLQIPSVDCFKANGGPVLTDFIATIASK